jgi:copper chaperone CopZ
MKKIFKIDGMHCKSCKSLIEGEIIDLDCVDFVSVSLEEEMAEIDLQGDDVGIVVEAINKLGFSARVLE